MYENQYYHRLITCFLYNLLYISNSSTAHEMFYLMSLINSTFPGGFYYAKYLNAYKQIIIKDNKEYFCYSANTELITYSAKIALGSYRSLIVRKNMTIPLKLLAIMFEIAYIGNVNKKLKLKKSMK